jgi:hypothetical protein
MPQLQRPRATPIEVARLAVGHTLEGAAAKTQIGKGTSPVEAMFTGQIERNGSEAKT